MFVRSWQEHRGKTPHALTQRVVGCKKTSSGRRLRKAFVVTTLQGHSSGHTEQLTVKPFPPIVWPPPEGASEDVVTQHLKPFHDVLRFISANCLTILQHPELYDQAKETLDALNLLNGVLDQHRRAQQGQGQQQQYTGVAVLDNSDNNRRQTNNGDEQIYISDDDDDGIPFLVRRFLNANIADEQTVTAAEQPDYVDAETSMFCDDVVEMECQQDYSATGKCV
ncbi:hypothetical protein niasHT_038210 [Heterodera trifolii]|uniref:Uncharacterized protein n=1 Tax=Heterodera trifolii TaxID=157864 RepID=A0ABD2J0M4_9BILA